MGATQSSRTSENSTAREIIACVTCVPNSTTELNRKSDLLRKDPCEIYCGFKTIIESQMEPEVKLMVFRLLITMAQDSEDFLAIVQPHFIEIFSCILNYCTSDNLSYLIDMRIELPTNSELGRLMTNILETKFTNIKRYRAAANVDDPLQIFVEPSTSRSYSPSTNDLLTDLLANQLVDDCVKKQLKVEFDSLSKNFGDVCAKLDIAEMELQRARQEIESLRCSLCNRNPKCIMFDCRHIVCENCSPKLATCPFCRTSIQNKTKLFF